MQTEQLYYKGYTIEVAQDEDAGNPFEEWDTEPPLLVYHYGRRGWFKAYGEIQSLADIIRLLPDSLFERCKRVSLFREFLPALSSRDVALAVRDAGDCREAFSALMVDHCGDEPGAGMGPTDWFDTAEILLSWAGIECVNEQSNGYCQGDSALVLAIATPAWCDKVGVAPEHRAQACKGAVELYSAWAWGDVYGVAAIRTPSTTDEDGEETEGAELPDASCWGFYGDDHEKSGLLDHARSVIDGHIRDEQETALNEPACLI